MAMEVETTEMALEQAQSESDRLRKVPILRKRLKKVIAERDQIATTAAALATAAKVATQKPSLAPTKSTRG